MANPTGRPGAGPVWVLDTSAVLEGGWSSRADACVAPTRVAEEFSPGGRSFAQWQRLRAAGLQVHAPSEAALSRARQEAVRVGESGLSPADLEVAALAMDESRAHSQVVVVTDDYALQNLLAHLGLVFQGARAAGITQTRTYRLRCAGCARWFDPGTDLREGGVCPVCGSGLRRRQSKH